MTDDDGVFKLIPGIFFTNVYLRKIIINLNLKKPTYIYFKKC